MVLVWQTVDITRRLNNYVEEDPEPGPELDVLQQQLIDTRAEIEYLKSEILRLKMLLNGEDVIKNSLPTSREPTP